MKFYQINAQIWIDDEGGVVYYVDQSFDENGDDHEVLAHGEANDWEDARKNVFKSIAEIAN